MDVRFATCGRGMGLRFLKKFYPSREVTDNPDDAGPVLDLVVQDMFRIPDPDFHSGVVLPGPKWDEARRDECIETMDKFHKEA